MPRRRRDRQTTDDYLQRPYARLLIPNDDGSYSAEILEFTGCFSQGETPEEAVANVNHMAAEWLEAALKQGREIPEPFTTRGYSGTISLRIPRGLHRQAARMAERDGISLNQFLLSAIAARVGAEDLLEHVLNKLRQAEVNITTNVSALVLVDRQRELASNEGARMSLGFDAIARSDEPAILTGAR